MATLRRTAPGCLVVLPRNRRGLGPAYEGCLYPSKVYRMRAAGKPLLRLRPGLGVEDLRRAAAGPADITGSKQSTAVEAWVRLLAECASRRTIAAGAQGEQAA